MEREEVIKLILAMQQFSNKAIAEWTRLTNHNLGWEIINNLTKQIN